MIEAEFSYEVGALLKRKRRVRKMSRDTLAKIIGVHRNSIWRWEEGDCPLPLWQFLQISYALQIPYTAMLPASELRNTELRRHIERENLPPRKMVQAERDPPLTRRDFERRNQSKR